jgi:hypothetical protein
MTRPAHTTLEIPSTHNGENCTIETIWEVEVTLYPLVRATHLDPPEGGPEWEEPEVVHITISDADGNIMTTFNQKDHKDLIEILMVGIDELDLTPTDEDVRDALSEYGDPDDHGPW